MTNVADANSSPDVTPFSNLSPFDLQEARQLKAGDELTHSEGSQKLGASHRVTGADFSSHKSSVSEQQQRQTVTPAGTISEANSRKKSQSDLTITSKGVSTKKSSSMSSSAVCTFIILIKENTIHCSK